MINIFCLTQELNNGASIPRVNSIKHLEETEYPVCVQVDTQISDFQIDWADIVVVHRPVDEVHLKISKAVKEKGKKLWIDNDDDQLNLPIDHPAFLQYNRDDRRGYISESNKLADVVTISNESIRTSYSHLNTNIQYYPCAYDERIMPEPEISERTNTVVWRGSNTHSRSLVEFAPAIKKIDKKFHDWKFVFIGDYPWQVLEGITQNEWFCQTGYMPTQQLWNYTRSLKPAIQMVCLTDNQFTRSRSNMAMLDGTISGAITVARDFDHFDTPGVYNYRDADDFESVMVDLMCKFELKKDIGNPVEMCWKYIQAHQTFKEINFMQFEIVKLLMRDKL